MRGGTNSRMKVEGNCLKQSKMKILEQTTEKDPSPQKTPQKEEILLPAETWRKV